MSNHCASFFFVTFSIDTMFNLSCYCLLQSYSQDAHASRGMSAPPRRKTLNFFFSPSPNKVLLVIVFHILFVLRVCSFMVLFLFCILCYSFSVKASFPSGFIDF